MHSARFTKTGIGAGATGSDMADYTAVKRQTSELPPVLCRNADGASPFVLVCDHASNRIPPEYGDLGLTPSQRLMHIAWDPGAVAVARRLSRRLDAPLVESTISRLVVDCNRAADAPDLIPELSERTVIPGNRDLTQAERAARLAAAHTPFHEAIRTVLDARAAAGRKIILVTVHSFTPVYRDIPRPWPIGLIHGRDPAFTDALRAALLAEKPDLNIGWNEPYSALNGVTFTLEHHGDGRGLPATMIEIRNDEILSTRGVEAWTDRLAHALAKARGAAHGRCARPSPAPATIAG